VRRRNTLLGKRAGDLGETSAVRVLELDPLDDASRKRCGPTGGTSNRMAASGLAAAAQEPLKFVDRDEPLAPRVSTVSIAGTTLRSIVAGLTPSASAARRRV
jgi:hypothetical protein